MPPAARSFSLGISKLHSAGGGLVGDLGIKLAHALQELVGRPVELSLLDTYQHVLDALTSGRVDLAWLPPLLQADAEKRGAKLVALPQRSGSVAFRGALLVRKDSRFRGPAELLGARAAWRNAQSTSGYIFPRLELLQLGGAPAAASGAPFASEHFYGSVMAGVEAVVRGEADFCACFMTKVAAQDPALQEAELFKTLGHLAEPLRVVHVTGLIPPDAFCVGGHLAPEDEAALAKALHSVHTTPAGASVLQALVQAERLVPVQQVMLQSLRSWAAMIEERAETMGLKKPGAAPSPPGSGSG
jgi:phosphonate transport system substrate-binding protein